MYALQGFLWNRPPRGVETPVVHLSQQQTTENFAEKIRQQFCQWKAKLSVLWS